MLKKPNAFSGRSRNEQFGRLVLAKLTDRIEAIQAEGQYSQGVIFKPFAEGSMIPAFDNMGYLPAGVHLASLDEIDVRFGCNSELRRVQMESVRWLVDIAKRAGIVRIVLNGSFTTDALEPNDVDCVLLAGTDFPRDQAADEELVAGLPFLQCSIVAEADFREIVDRFFASDRDGTIKGMIEVAL